METETRKGAIEKSLAAVRGRGFLGRLRPEVIEEVIESAPFVRYAARETFRVETSIVASGLLGYGLSHPNGRHITIKYVTAGDLVPDAGLQASALSTGVQAIEPSVLLQLDPARLRAVSMRHPEVSQALLENLTDSLRSAYRALATRSFASVRSRVAGDLVGRARAGRGLYPGVQLRVTHQGLADSIGSVREVVARSLIELRRQGVVATGHSLVTIVDVDALASEAGLEGTLPP